MSSAERTAMALCFDSLDNMDGHFAKLRQEKLVELGQVPRVFPHDRVLLASGGPKGSGDLYVFAGMLHGASLKATQVLFEKVERFWCPVVAIYGDLQRTDLTGDREGWGPNLINYVLPKALERAPWEAERLLHLGMRVWGDDA
jgi:hypothetical protein